MAKTQIKAYCMKLKENVIMTNAVISRKFSRGAMRYMAKGTDPSGKYNVAKIMGKEDAMKAIESGHSKGEWEKEPK